ncbi:metallophosphatase family protein [bacterium]|nr:metallophosphatase family protein [bacterium]
MKVFVFSDSHLRVKYDKKFFDWVKYWCEKADKVIICGDFWDSELCTFEEFINSDWKKELFPLLKSKGAHYIFGNHDSKERSDNNANLFSETQSEAIDLDLDGLNLHFEHGHGLVDDLNLEFLKKYGYWIQYYGFKIVGKSFLNMFKCQIDDIKGNWAGEKRFLICGHTHYGATNQNFHVLNPSAFGLLYGLMIDNGKLFEIKKYEKFKISETS